MEAGAKSWCGSSDSSAEGAEARVIPALSSRVEAGLAPETSAPRVGSAGAAVLGGHVVVPPVAPVGAQPRQPNNIRSGFRFGASGPKRDAAKFPSGHANADPPEPGAHRSNSLDESRASHAELLLPRVAESSHVAVGDATDLLNAADEAGPPVPSAARSSDFELCWNLCTQ